MKLERFFFLFAIPSYHVPLAYPESKPDRYKWHQLTLTIGLWRWATGTQHHSIPGPFSLVRMEEGIHRSS